MAKQGSAGAKARKSRPLRNRPRENHPRLATGDAAGAGRDHLRALQRPAPADTLRLGFYTANDAGVRSFVGLDNYRTILFDPDWSAAFWNAMWNNVKFFCIHMALQNPIGLLLATLFSLKGLRGRAPTAR
jgi:hypothetical protein